jgi:transcription initiation factor IIE alpha subunit
MTYETQFVCKICGDKYDLNEHNRIISNAIDSIEKELKGLKPKQRAIVDRIIQILQELVLE